MEGTVLLVLSMSVVLLLLLSKLIKSLLVAKPKHNMPPGPWTVPVIGNLHNVITGPNIHRAMRRLSRKHGPLMSLRLGEVAAVVVSSPEAVQEVMKAHDIAFSDRHRVLRAGGHVLACRKRIQRILEQIIQETKDAGTESECFVSVLLRLQKERSTPIPLDDETIMAVMFDMFAAGSETSSTTLIWCMTELVRNPDVMARAQAEVREAFKGKNTITEQDLKGLRYLRLVIKEALRLHTPAPLLVPRKCRETCQVMDYDVPKGTAVFVNMWAICRDPKYWDDPEEFKPQRFDNSDLDYKGTNYEFLPFGAGRRICPGINLGVGNIELALASLVYHFDWKLPDGIEPKDVDIFEAAGLVASKKTSLMVHPVTRIPPANV
ncbi:unnamed protein product [Urochloa decumbens]|uniref:Cytochrome P450 n=1 Tax=Urochloa decumbens TaxID=240449 RepID=A0ABC9AQZ2_9POAL